MIQFVTGANDHLFFQTLLLLQSFENFKTDIKVCDFGFTPGERSFLASRNQLLTASIPKKFKHPWYQKTALVDFVPDADAIIWLDADVIAVRDPRAETETLVAEMHDSGAVIAACKANGPDLSGFCLKWIQIENEGRLLGEGVAPFLKLLNEFNVDLGHPYLNTGVFIATDRDWLVKWEALTFNIKPHFCFDQSTFNALAWINPKRVRLLDERRWNVHGTSLDHSAPDAIMLHATSEAGLVREVPLTVNIRNKHLKTVLRLFANVDLKNQQLDLLNQFNREHGEEMAEHLYGDL